MQFTENEIARIDHLLAHAQKRGRVRRWATVVMLAGGLFNIGLGVQMVHKASVISRIDSNIAERAVTSVDLELSRWRANEFCIRWTQGFMHFALGGWFCLTPLIYRDKVRNDALLAKLARVAIDKLGIAQPPVKEQPPV